MKSIRLKLVVCYGQYRYYPLCDLSSMILEILHRKSLTYEQVALIAKRGYKIEITEE